MRFAGSDNAKMRQLGRLQMASMIDIVFLLLIYFMLTTTLEPPESQLSPRSLQAAPGSPRRSSPSQSNTSAPTASTPSASDSVCCQTAIHSPPFCLNSQRTPASSSAHPTTPASSGPPPPSRPPATPALTRSPMSPAATSRSLAICAALALAPTVCAQGQAQTEAVERYLTARGLDSLEFESIIARLDDVSESERQALVERAAELLSELLESESSPALQREWGERAKDLLRKADGPAAAALEIRLLRAAYQRAERAAERWRLRTATDSEATAAERTLTDAAIRLERIARQTEQRADTFEKRLTVAVGAERDRLREEVAALRATRSQARYLAGWCRLYLAQLKDDPDDAREALTSFAWILGAPDKATPELARLNTDSLALDHVARAAIGAAAAFAILGDANAADDWLTTAATHGGPDIAAVADSWRLVIDAHLGRWDALTAALEESPDPTAARLVVVESVEAINAGTSAVTSARRALEAGLSALIDLGDSASVVELSRLYGALPVPGRGFLARYTEGVGLYLDADSRLRLSGHPSDQPVPSGVHRTNFQTAARALTSALSTNDAQSFPGAVAETRAILGASLFYAASSPADLAEARGHLEAASSGLPDLSRRAGALWLAARCARLESQQLTGDASLEASRAADEIAAFPPRVPAPRPRRRDALRNGNARRPRPTPEG